MNGSYKPDWIKDEVEYRFYHHYPLTWDLMKGVLTSKNRKPLKDYHVMTFEEFYCNKLNADQCTIPQVREKIEEVNDLADKVNSALHLNTPEKTCIPKILELCDIAIMKTTKPATL